MALDVSAMGNIGSVVLVSGYGVMRLIKMLKGKFNNKGGSAPDPKCPDAGCQAQVGQNTQEIKETKDDLKDFKKDIYPKIEQTAKDTNFIRGWIEREKIDGG